MIVGGNMDNKALSDEVLDGNEEQVIRHWRKGNPWYKVIKNCVPWLNCVLVFGGR